MPNARVKYYTSTEYTAFESPSNEGLYTDQREANQYIQSHT